MRCAGAFCLRSYRPMCEITLRSCAKVNLTLEVGGIRSDGFHEIDSVVQTIDLSDELSIRPAGEGVIDVVVTEGGAPEGPANLVFRACEVFLRTTKVRGGARISLRKRIPMEAGLGGGSSNAAAVIVGLDTLYGCGLPTEVLTAIAAQVGSDVGLFILGGTVRMRGRGDRMTALRDAPQLGLVILKPEEGVSTTWAYAELDRRGKRGSRGASGAAEESIVKGDRDGLVRSLHNDFDCVVSARVDGIRRARRALEQHNAERVLLAGSGSAVLGVYESMDRAEAVAQRLSEEFAGSYAARFLTRAESAPGRQADGQG